MMRWRARRSLSRTVIELGASTRPGDRRRLLRRLPGVPLIAVELQPALAAAAGALSDGRSMCARRRQGGRRWPDRRPAAWCWFPAFPLLQRSRRGWSSASADSSRPTASASSYGSLPAARAVRYRATCASSGATPWCGATPLQQGVGAARHCTSIRDVKCNETVPCPPRRRPAVLAAQWPLSGRPWPHWQSRPSGRPQPADQTQVVPMSATEAPRRGKSSEGHGAHAYSMPAFVAPLARCISEGRAAVEFRRMDVERSPHLQVERRRRLHPAAFRCMAT